VIEKRREEMSTQLPASWFDLNLPDLN